MRCAGTSTAHVVMMNASLLGHPQATDITVRVNQAATAPDR